MTDKRTWQIKIQGDLQLTVPADISNYTTYILLEQEDWCEPEINFVRELIESGMTVLDLDTGYGVYALTMAKEMEGQGRVIALNANNHFSHSVQENNLQDLITTQLDDSPLDVIRLGDGDAQPEEKLLKQGDPLLMFPATQRNINFFQAQGLHIYEHIPSLNILAPHLEGHTPANLFACSQDQAARLEEDELLSTSPDTKASTHQSWQAAIANLPYARSDMHKWRATSLDPSYEQALNAYLSSLDPDLPPGRRLALLQRSWRLFTELFQTGDQDIATYLALIRIHCDLGRRSRAASLATAFLSKIRQGMPLSFDRPFVPPMGKYDTRPLQRDRGNWLTAAIVETQLTHQDYSSFDVSQEGLNTLHQLTRLPDHSLEMERRQALCAWRNGVDFSLGAQSRLLTSEHLNPEVWQEIAGIQPAFQKPAVPEQQPNPSPVALGRKIGRNAPCPCGSGKKFKKCCEQVKPSNTNSELNKQQSKRQISLEELLPEKSLERSGSILWLIEKEKQFGGVHTRVPRNKVSELDPRPPEKYSAGYIKKEGRILPTHIGGDRMSPQHHGYSLAYSTFIQKFRELEIVKEEDLVLVEVGILKGTGLAIWCDLFPKATIIGLDIDIEVYKNNIDFLKSCGAFQHNEPYVYEFDQFAYNQGKVKEILNDKKVDILIDDGAHTRDATITTFKSFEPFLVDNFLYFIEDLPQVADYFTSYLSTHRVLTQGWMAVVCPDTGDWPKRLPSFKEYVHQVHALQNKQGSTPDLERPENKEEHESSVKLFGFSSMQDETKFEDAPSTSYPPTVEIYVFSYNRAKSLNNCIKSIEDCAPGYNVTIVDDSSDDDETIDLINDLRKKYKVIQPKREIFCKDDQRTGGLYNNMQFAFEDANEKGIDWVLCLQDDTQMVRSITNEDIQKMHTFFENNKKSFELYVGFRKAQFESNDKYQICLVDSNAYKRISSAKGIKSGFTAVGLFHIPRFFHYFETLENTEPLNDKKALDKVLCMGIYAYPFMMWLPFPAAYRNRQRDELSQKIDELAGAGFHPINYMTEEQKERLFSRDLNEIPVAERFLTCPTVPNEEVWSFEGGLQNLIAQGGEKRQIAAKVQQLQQSGKQQKALKAVKCERSSKNVYNNKELNELFKNPIIIGGCGRSGTTLLLSILSCHPSIYCIGDETCFLCPSGYNHNRVDYTNLPRTQLLYSYLQKREIPKESIYWCEKTPKNVLFFANILSTFGKNARLIHIVRDPRDVITSKHPSNPDKFYVPIERWTNDVKSGKNFYSHEQVLTLRYEDLILDYNNQLKKVCEFVGLEYDKRFESYPETATLKGTAEQRAWFGSRKSISASSIGRWKNEQHTERINELMQNQEAVELMRFFGYLS